MAHQPTTHTYSGMQSKNQPDKKMSQSEIMERKPGTQQGQASEAWLEGIAMISHEDTEAALAPQAHIGTDPMEDRPTTEVMK